METQNRVLVARYIKQEKTERSQSLLRFSSSFHTSTPPSPPSTTFPPPLFIE